VALGVKKKRKLVFSKVVRIGEVTYDGNAHTVTVRLAKPTKGTLQVTVFGGILAADGAFTSGNFLTRVP